MLSNKKVIISIIITSVLGLLIFLVTKTVIKLKHKERIATQIKILPHLPVKAIGSNKVEEWSKSGKVTIIIFFNSGCEHCQYETTSIAQEILSFTGINLLFISDESEKEIGTFSRVYKLDNNPEVWWLKMKPDDVYNTFGNIGVPHIWLYDEDGKLVKEFKGETRVEAILEWL